MNRIVVYISCLIVLFCGNASAQNVSFYAQVDKTAVAVGERFRLTLVLENAQANINIPNLAAFNVLGGPYQSSQQRWVNGRRSSSLSLSYILSPKIKGNHVIGSAQVSHNGQTYRTKPITIKVSEGAPASNLKPNSVTKNENLFASIIVDKKTVYEGEPIVVKFALYTLYNAYSNLNLQNTNIPSTIDGFWSTEISKKQINWESNLVNVNGRNYRVAVLNEKVLIPQRAGRFTIKDFSFEVVVGAGFFNRGRNIKALADPYTINVKELPNKPITFSGGVGNFGLKTNISAKSIKTNDPITLKLTLNGQGNLKLISTPPLDLNNEFEVFEPKIIDNIKVDRSGMKGSRTFEYVIIPRYPGKYRLPPIDIVYYNLSQKKYITLSTPEYSIEVADDGSSEGATLYGDKKDVKILEESLRFIRKNTEFQKSKTYFYETITYHVLLFLPWLFFLVVFIITKRKKNIGADKLRMKKAGRSALKKIRQAEKFLHTKEQQKVFSMVQQAIFKYFVDKTKIGSGEMSIEKIEEILTRQKAPDTLLSELKEIIHTCQMSEYAPISNTATEILTKQSKDMIRKLEKTF